MEPRNRAAEARAGLRSRKDFSIGGSTPTDLLAPIELVGLSSPGAGCFPNVYGERRRSPGAWMQAGALALLQLLFDRPRHFLRIRRDGRLEALDYFPVPIHQELGEVPLDRSGDAWTRFFRQIGIQRRLVVTFH